MDRSEHSTHLPLLPVEEAVLLPGMSVTAPLIGEEQTAAVDHAVEHTDGMLVAVPRIDEEYAPLGVVTQITAQIMLPDGSRGVSVEALHRAQIGPASERGDTLIVPVTPITEPDETTPRIDELTTEYRAVVGEVAAARGDQGRVATFLRAIDHPGRLADTIGYAPEVPVERKAEVLEAIDIEKRLEIAIAAQRERLAEITLRQRIRDDVNEGLERTQKEAILRRQMDAIRKELDEATDESTDEWRARIEAADMPEAARKEAERELSRLERMSDGAEAGMIRTYLEWMVSIPWGILSEDSLDVSTAREVLDADHTGLEKVKERILEYLAVRRLRREREMDDGSNGVILALVGPPGVGKTSLGESIARATNREFVRISLGGIRDEAEIRGHRRTYVGALPGRFVRALRDAGTRNPVVLLDELDKVGADWRGDPSAALLEVLDPAQNHTFRDHYLDVDLDLSQVLFVATANMVDTIPAPLLDRMEVINLDGYTDDEKRAIAQDHLVPRQIERNGLHEGEVTVLPEAIDAIVSDYTREAGVRGLERALGTVIRKAATRVAEGETDPITVGPDDLVGPLGRPKFHHEAAERTARPGVATGLAVTGTGGDVLFVEARDMPKDGGDGLVLTGQLGDVMRESARIALSWTRGNTDELGISEDRVTDRCVHVHVPAGAIPKDGPSAGITMVTALASLYSDRPVKPNVGMTGEVTLQGRVLPIGGIKQKLLAAHRAGLTEVVIPERNRGDLDDVPQSVLDDLTVHPVLTVQEVLDVALEPISARHEPLTHH